MICKKAILTYAQRHTYYAIKLIFFLIAFDTQITTHKKRDSADIIKLTLFVLGRPECIDNNQFTIRSLNIQIVKYYCNTFYFIVVFRQFVTVVHKTLTGYCYKKKRKFVCFFLIYESDDLIIGRRLV